MALAVFTLKIKLFKERVAAVVCVKFKVPAAPPIVKLEVETPEDAVPVRFPEPETAAFNVKVLEPIERLPLVSASVPPTVTFELAFMLTPAALLMVKLEKVLAVINWAAAPLYSTVEPLIKLTPPVAVILPAIAPPAFKEPTLNMPPLLTVTAPAPDITLVPKFVIEPETTSKFTTFEIVPPLVKS